LKTGEENESFGVYGGYGLVTVDITTKEEDNQRHKGTLPKWETLLFQTGISLPNMPQV
jgi:hypothetical protein